MTSIKTTSKRGMVLAAGLGTRMQHLTVDKPKPLIPVKYNGTEKPMIDHVLAKLIGEGAEQIVINCHYKAEMLANHLEQFLQVKAIHEKTLLGQGGGIKNALPLLGNEPFFTTNSDALWTGNALATLFKTWDTLENPGALLLLMPTKKVPSYTKAGDFDLATDGQLSWSKEDKTAPYLYTGIQLLNPNIFQKYDKKIFSLQEVYDDLIVERRLFGVVHSGDWFHLGTLEELAAIK